MSKSFVTSVRCDYQHIAAIGKFLESKQMKPKTRGRIASIAIKILAEHLPVEFQTNSLSQAVNDLAIMGFQTVTPKQRYFKVLNKNLETEQKAAPEQADLVSMVEKIKTNLVQAETEIPVNDAEYKKQLNSLPDLIVSEEGETDETD